MRAGSVVFAHAAVDPEQTRREREETQRVLADARAAIERADRVALKVRRMNALYREREIGSRERPE